MNKKTVSVLLLTLLSISVITLAFSIQPAKCDPANFVPVPRWCKSRDNKEWCLYQFANYEEAWGHGIDWLDNRNCGPACSGMVINYLSKNQKLYSDYDRDISHDKQGESTSLTATILTDTTAYWVPSTATNSLVGLELNPNVDQDKTFIITSNTKYTITIDEKDGKLTDVATNGDSYAIYYDVYSETRWKYSQAYLHSRNIPDKLHDDYYKGYYNDYKSFSGYGAHTEQIQYTLSVEGIEYHTLTGDECKNGTGIQNIEDAINQDKVCICLVRPMHYRDTDYKSTHWVTVYGYNDNYIYLNDPGWSDGDGFPATKSDFADALSKIYKPEVPTIIVIEALEPFSWVPVDVVLVLDRSGSMGGTIGDKTKMQGAKDSAIGVVNSLMPLDRVAVVSFSSYGTTNVHLTNDFEYAKAEIQKINAGGMTSFGAGMSLALNELESGRLEGHAWAIIFMSNGWHNTYPLPHPYVAQCKDKGIPIYTIGLGSSSGNVNEPLLKWMASETGGKYLFAPSLYELQNIFLRFSLEVTGWTPVDEFSGIVYEDQIVTAGTFDVAPFTAYERITLNWPGSDLDLIIERPDGSEVDLMWGIDNIYSGATVKPEWVVLLAPQEGTWTVKVYGKTINSPDEPFTVWISTYSPPAPQDTEPPTITVETPSEHQALQDGVTLTALVSDPSDVDWVQFSIREPNGEQGTIIDSMFESMPATHTGDDTWQLPFDTTALPDGYYMLLVKAADMLGNEGNATVEFSIRNWACVELLPSSESNKGGRTMPVKFSLRVVESVDPDQPFVWNEELSIIIYEEGHPETILQNSIYGDTARDYRIDPEEELYITNFKTLKKPTTYVVEIYRKDMLIGTIEFSTEK
ncbi:peptidase C39 family protein [Candidatus Bathyarchaeota archaeon]|nr:peptidase C39 family protein [Candidatus Bathyarchaeota archaeon]